MQYLQSCPVCNNPELNPFLQCKDYTVSHETFKLEKCHRCGLLMTNPRPHESELPAYYESETYISHSDKPSGIIDQVYKLARQFTLRWKHNLILKHSLKRPESLLDYGCGTGAFLKHCQAQHIKIAGIEPSPKAREQAELITGTKIMSQISEVRDRFDVITLWHVLEHVPNLSQTIDNLRDRLNETGTIFIAVPNHESLDAKKYKQFWAGYDVPRHLWHFSRNTIQKILEKHQLKLVNVLPMKLDAYYVSLLSEKYFRGANNVTGMASALKTGWKSNRSANNTSDYSSLIYIIRK